MYHFEKKWRKTITNRKSAKLKYIMFRCRNYYCLPFYAGIFFLKPYPILLKNIQFFFFERPELYGFGRFSIFFFASLSPNHRIIFKSQSERDEKGTRKELK